MGFRHEACTFEHACVRRFYDFRCICGAAARVRLGNKYLSHSNHRNSAVFASGPRCRELSTKPESRLARPKQDRQSAKKAVTAYPGFANACVNVFSGYQTQPGKGPSLLPTFEAYQGACSVSQQTKPLVFSVTHENDHNNHYGAANYNKNIASYVGDYNPKMDMGRWLDLQLINTTVPPSVIMRLDTARHDGIDVTGWPIQFGHLFIALNDETVTASLKNDVYLELDIEIQTNKISTRAGNSGRRVMIGALGDWTEAQPRTNRLHFLEVDLVQSEGYSASYKEPTKELCQT